MMSKPALYELPFDQFSRQQIVKEIVDRAFRQTGNKSLKILDFGGHKGHTKDFYPEDEVFILDVFNEKYKNYIKGDATHTKLESGSYDLVLSFDTLEHIPPEKRESFIKEAARVGKAGFILAAPFDNQKAEVSSAEKNANDTYAFMNQQQHPWLCEHAEYGLPDPTKIEAYITKAGLYFAKIPTNELGVWLIAQELMFNATVFDNDIKEVVDVSRYYNEHLSDMETHTEPSYRHIYVASKNKAIVDMANKYFIEKKPREHTVYLEYLNLVGRAYGAMLKRLRGDVQYLQEREKHLQSSYDEQAKLAVKLEARLQQKNFFKRNRSQ